MKVMQLAELDNAVGEFRLGKVQESLSQKIRSLTRSSDHGTALAQLELAKLAQKRRSFNEFGRYSKQAADDGEPLGFLYLSLALAEGWEIPENSNITSVSFERAAELCGSYGSNIYAKELEILGGFAEDPLLKAKLLKMGSDAGSSICSRRYAELLSGSESIVHDPIEANRYFKLAADRGDSPTKGFMRNS
jgi:TPR repeat protein